MNNPTTWLNAIWKSELPSHSKLLAAYLRRFMNDDSDIAYPSLARISHETSITKKTALKYLDVLEDKGYLVKQSGNSLKSNRYISKLPESYLGSVPLTPRSVRDTPQVVEDVHPNKQGLNKQSNKPLVGYDFILDQYHGFCTKLKTIKKLTDVRKKHINARFDLLKTEDEWTEYFKTVSTSSFLNGINDRAWKADLDWLINETNMVKILEGNYVDKTIQPTTPAPRKFKAFPKGE